MEANNSTGCPICGSNKFSKIYRCTDHFVTKEQFDVVKCEECQFMLTADAPDADSIDKYYQTETYISHSDTNRGVTNRLYHFARQLMLKNKRELVEKISPTKKGVILDIGTGTGYFLNEMKRASWSVIGTESSSDARQFAQKNFSLTIDPPNSLFSYEEGQFDIITLWHVLEHIHDLNRHMETFSRLLKEEGILIIAVPNYLSQDARHYKEYWAAWDVPRHLWHFKPDRLKKLGELHGFKTEKTITMPFDAFYVSILSEQYKRTGAPVIRGLIRGSLSWLNTLFNKEECSSLIYILSKQRIEKIDK